MHQEANNNNNSIINQINIPDKESAEVLATALSQFMNSDVQIVCNTQNQDKLNKLYQEFSEIVNSFDSMWYISKDDLDKLKSCIVKMELFEDDFQNESDEGKLFYNNFFALLLRIDVNLFVEKYEKSPDYVRSVLNNKYLYACSLFEVNRKDDAIKQIDEIIELSGDIKYFIQKCYFLFIENNIHELKRLLSKVNKKEDKFGYFGVFELEILLAREKNIIKLKKLNKKYKNKPLYHIRMAEIIYNIDKRKTTEIRENLKIAFLNIKDDDFLILLKLFDTTTFIKQENYLIDLIINKQYNSKFINCKILTMLMHKENKNENDIKKIKEMMEILRSYELVDFDVANAFLSLENHKELEAIDYFNNSYKKNKSLYVASNLLRLILKNNDSRNFNNLLEYIEILNSSKKADDYMLIASAYLILGNQDMALENAYIGAIVSKNSNDCFMRFWAIHTKFIKQEEIKLKNVTNECVIELSDLRKKKKITIALDKNISNKFNISYFQGVRFVNDSNFELSIVGKSVGDTVSFNGGIYKITNIIEKYDYFLKLIFPKINSGKYFKAIVSDDSDDPLKGIREFLIETKKSNDKYFEMYDLEKTGEVGLPLSSFVNNEDKTYRDIMLHLLYVREDSKLYSGEINIVDKNNDFIIDITSLVMLEQFDLLSRMKQIGNNIYVTQSTINTINKTFNYYLNNKKDTLSVFVDDDEELRKQEITEEDYKILQEFWRNVLESASQFNIVNHESCLDKSHLESCQIDSIDYSIKNKCILISEDLLLKKFAYASNDRILNSTNFLSIAEFLCIDASEYINIISALSKGNYLYCLSEITFLKITLYSFVNKEHQSTILKIVDNIFSTKYLYYNYLEIVVRVILYIFYYENIEDEIFYIKLLDKIQYYSKKYNNNSCYDMLEKIKNDK